MQVDIFSFFADWSGFVDCIEDSFIYVRDWV
jgi:hypothetical protein